jgi:hypothetical protein
MKMNDIKEVIFYENAYDIKPETCEYIFDKGMLRSENGLIESSYPTGIKEIKADVKSLIYIFIWYLITTKLLYFPASRKLLS